MPVRPAKTQIRLGGSQISLGIRPVWSAWAFAQSDQSLCCPQDESLGPYLSTEHTAETLIRLGGCGVWSNFPWTIAWNEIFSTKNGILEGGGWGGGEGTGFQMITESPLDSSVIIVILITIIIIATIIMIISLNSQTYLKECEIYSGFMHSWRNENSLRGDLFYC